MILHCPTYNYCSLDVKSFMPSILSLFSVRGSSNSKLTWIMWQHLGLIFHCGICMPQCVTGNVVFHKTATLEFRGALNFVYILEDALMNAFVDMSSWMQKCKSVHLCFLFFWKEVCAPNSSCRQDLLSQQACSSFPNLPLMLPLPIILSFINCPPI